MRNDPYVVVISGLQTEAEFLSNLLEDLGVSSFFPGRDTQPGENRAERLRTELNTADVVLVGANPPKVELEELQNAKSRRAMDPAFTIIPVVSRSEPTIAPGWLQAFKPLVYDVNDPAKTISSLVRVLMPDRETEPEETLDELVAEAERLLLRLKSTFDQYRHSRILLGISFLVFASGVSLVTIGIWTGTGGALSGFLQFLGLVVLPLGGFFFLYSIVNWSSNFQRKLRSQRLIDEGDLIILEYKSFREANPRQAAHETGSFVELVKRFSEFLRTYRQKAATTAKERDETVNAESSSQQSEKEQEED